MLKRNKSQKVLTILLGVFLLCIISVAFNSKPTSAVATQNISDSQLTKLAEFEEPDGYQCQGAAVTDKYFIYTQHKVEGNDNSTVTLKMCARTTKSCSTLISGKYGHAASLYNKWGSDYIQILDSAASHEWCVSMSQKKEVALSKCPRIGPSGLSRASNTGILQGYTKYGEYYLRGWGKRHYKPNEIRIYKGKNNLVKILYLPNSIDEIEDITVEGSTGDVIFAANIFSGCCKRIVKFYRLSKNVLSFTPSSDTYGSEKRQAKKSAAKKKTTTTKKQDYTYVSKNDGVVDTLFFGTIQDDGAGCGVYTILDFIMTTMTIGIGILAVIGITLSGITYLTAGADVSKTTKAKRRLYEIVIGLAAYAAIWAILSFLLPEFNPQLKTCHQLSSEEIAARDAEKAEANKANNEANKKANEEANKAATGSPTGYSSDSSKSSSSKSSSDNDVADKDATAIGNKMLEAAEWTAQYMAKHKFIYFQYDCSNGYCNSSIRKGYGPYEGESLTWERAKKVRYSHCSSFATLVEKKAGLLPDQHKYHSFIYNGSINFKNDASKNKLLKNFTIVHGGGATLKTLVKQKKLRPGDVFGYHSSYKYSTHTMIYAGYKNKKYWIYEVNAPNNTVLKYNGGLHTTISGSKKIGDILHAK